MTYEQSHKINNDFIWLMYWFWTHSNGDWEHCYGISLETLGNDKWILSVDTSETELADQTISWANSVENDENKIIIESSSSTLFQSMKTLRNYAEPYSKISHIVNKLNFNDEPLMRLLTLHKKFHRSPEFKISISTLDNPGWMLKITLDKLNFKYKNFNKINYSYSENNWIFGKIENNMFTYACGPFNLLDAIQIFLDMLEPIAKENNNE